MHAGHRERMIHKLLNSPESFSDYELIEILLYSVIPRKNTNEIAHKLFHVFGSLEKIFNTSAKELKTVDGIGDKAAAHIIMFAQLFKRINIKKMPDYKCNNYSTVRGVFIDYFSGLNYEKLVVAMFDKAYTFKNTICFTENNPNSVSVDLKELANAFAINKPAFVIIGHNHPSGNVNPSAEDDVTTTKIFQLCQIHGVELLDHVIIAGNGDYSYRHDSENRLDKIKNTANLETVFRI